MKQWFVVYTKSKREALAGENLQRQGYEYYCPLIQEKRRYKNAWCGVVGPLFPRYLFIHLEEGLDSFSPIRSTVGIVGFVRFGGKPKSVPQKLITAIKAREESELGVIIKPMQQWKPGDEVEFVEGPFIGFRGIFNSSCGKERVNILLRMLGNEKLVTTTQDLLMPVE